MCGRFSVIFWPSLKIASVDIAVYSWVLLISNQCRTSAYHYNHMQSQWKSYHFTAITRNNFGIICICFFYPNGRDLITPYCHAYIGKMISSCDAMRYEMVGSVCASFFLSCSSLWYPNLLLWNLMYANIRCCSFRLTSFFPFDIPCGWKRITS